jgi:DNA-binding NarL/FixJ family response regulator
MNKLHKREKEVLIKVAEGSVIKNIGPSLGIESATAFKCWETLKRKLQFDPNQTGISQAVKYCIKNKLISI